MKTLKKLKRRFYSFLLSVLLFSSFCAPVIVTGNNQSMEEVESHIVSLGTHLVGETITIATEVKHEEPKEFIVKKIKTSCGCTKADVESWTIKPSHNIKLKITVDSLGREGDFSQSIILITNSPTKPVYKIKVKGKFVASDHNLIASPSAVYFGKYAPDSKVGQVIKITRNGRLPVGPVSVTSTSNWCKVNIIQERKTETKIYLDVEVCMPKTSKKIHEEIFIQGSDPNDFLRIPLNLDMALPIKITPNKVFVVPDEENYRFLVDTPDSRLPKLLDYSFQSDGLEMSSCKTCPQEPNCLLTVIKRKKSYKGLARGKLQLKYENISELLEIMFFSIENATN